MHPDAAPASSHAESPQEVAPVDTSAEQDSVVTQGGTWDVRFPFGVNSRVGTGSALFDLDGNLTACGRYYRSVTPDYPAGDQTIEPDPPHHR